MQPTVQPSNQPLGHPSDRPTRQLLTLPTSISALSHHVAVTATEYSSTKLRVSPEEVQATFIKAPRSSSAEDSSVVYSFLWSIAGAMVLGLIIFGCWDITHPTGPHSSNRSSSSISGRMSMSLDSDDCERDPSCARRGIVEFFESLYPDRLRPSEWYAVLYRQLCRDHPLWKLFVTADRLDACSCLVLNKSFSWVGFIAGLVAWICSCTIIVYVLFADDGRCEAITDHSSCVNAGPSSWFSIGWKACSWQWDNDSCVFRGPDHSSFPTVMAIALVAGALSSPIRRVTDRMVVYTYLQWRRRGREAKRSNLIQRGDRLNYHDEFGQALSKRSMWLRAARLVKLQESMDLVPPEQEAAAIQCLLSSSGRQRDDDDDDAWLLVDRNGCMHSSSDTRAAAIVSRVNDSRAEAIRLRALCEVQLDEAKEALLMRHFIVGLFAGYQKRVVASFYFGANSNQLLLQEQLITSVDSSCYSRFLRYGSCVGLPLLLAIMMYCTAVLGASIGSRSIDLWLVVVLGGLVIDNLAIQVIVVWLTWSVIYNSVAIEFESIMRNLKGKSRIILRRTTGVMRPCNDLVQHLNPACRVARMFPGYPVSRLLLSINDGDIADKVDPLRKSRWDAAIGCSVGWVMYLPQVISAVALDWMALVLFDGGLLAVFHFGRYSLVAACIVVGALLAVAVVWIARIEWRYSRVQIAKQRAYNWKVFRQVDEEDAIQVRAMKSRAAARGVLLPIDPLDCNAKQDDVDHQKALDSVIRKHSIPSAVRHTYLRSKGVQVAPLSLTPDAPPRPQQQQQQQVAADASSLATIDMQPASHQSSFAMTDDVSFKASLTSLLVRGGYPRLTMALSGPPLSSLVNRVFGPAVDAAAFFDPKQQQLPQTCIPCPDVTHVPDLQQYVDADRDFASKFGKIWNPAQHAPLLEVRSKKNPLPRRPAAVPSSVGADEAPKAHRRRHRTRVDSTGTILPPTDQLGEDVETHIPKGPGAALLKWGREDEERVNTSTQLLQSMSKPASSVDLQNYAVFLARAKQSRSFDRFVPSSPDIDFALIAGSSAAAIVASEATQSALASSGYHLNSGGARTSVRSRRPAEREGDDRRRAAVDEGPGNSSDNTVTPDERRGGR